MNSLRLTIVASVGFCGIVPLASAAPARFWLSTSSVSPNSPEAPQFMTVMDTVRFLHIWGRPGTVGDGAHGSTNPFRTLQSISLDIISKDASLLFVDGSYTVYNPMVGESKPRFGIVNDSHTLPPDGPVSAPMNCEDPGVIACVRGLQGFSIPIIDLGGMIVDFDGTGIGPICQEGDPYCASAGDESPAWLLASFAIKVVQNTGVADVHLQIGANGIAHRDDNDLSVVPIMLGSAPNDDPDPIYNANYHRDPGDEPDEFLHRQVTLPGDDPDARITAVSISAIQQMSWEENNGGMWSDHSWSVANSAPSFSSNVRLPNSLGSAVVDVNGKQAANHTIVDGGRLRIAGGSSLSSDVVVCTHGGISGKGWVSGDLDLLVQGTLFVDSAVPLLVAGRATLTQADLKIGDYAQGQGSASEWVEILRANGGIQGTFATAPGTAIGGGLRLESIRYESDRVFARFQSIRMPGDYSGDGLVGPEDYLHWRSTYGSNTKLAADGSGNNIIDTADYVIWRNHQTVYLGDYNRNGVIGQDDYEFWRATFGQEVTHFGSSADGNGNGIVDAADYVVWRMALPQIPGDYDHDGVVDAEDYVYWRSTFGLTLEPRAGADGNGNGVIDTADYIVWRKQLGSGAAAETVIEVPEPDTRTLLLILLVLILRAGWEGLAVKKRHISRVYSGSDSPEAMRRN